MKLCSRVVFCLALAASPWPAIAADFYWSCTTPVGARYVDATQCDKGDVAVKVMKPGAQTQTGVEGATSITKPTVAPRAGGVAAAGPVAACPKDPSVCKRADYDVTEGSPRAQAITRFMRQKECEFLQRFPRRCGQPQPSPLAVSADGKFTIKAGEQPHTLVLLDAQSNVLKVLSVMDKNGKAPSRVAAVHDAPLRKSFVVALKDVAEVWEVSYDPTAEDIAVGMVHDFQYKEGAFIPGYLNPRRSYLPEALEDFSFTPDFSELIGTTRLVGKRVLVNLDVRRQIANLDVADAR